ncbi:MAG TPA: type VII secretion target [Micromonosporaceae bacterium]
MTGFKVEPQALERFAATSDARGDAFGNVRAAMAAAEVPGDSFGRIPGIGARIFQAYQQHVHACTEGIASAAEAMTAIAEGVRGMAANYHDADSASNDNMTALHGRLAGGAR